MKKDFIGILGEVREVINGGTGREKLSGILKYSEEQKEENNLGLTEKELQALALVEKDFREHTNTMNNETREVINEILDNFKENKKYRIYEGEDLLEILECLVETTVDLDLSIKGAKLDKEYEADVTEYRGYIIDLVDELAIRLKEGKDLGDYPKERVEKVKEQLKVLLHVYSEEQRTTVLSILSKLVNKKSSMTINAFN